MAGSLQSAKYAITNVATPIEKSIDINNLPFNIDLASEQGFYTANSTKKVIVLNGLRIRATDDDGISKYMKIYLARDLFKLIHIDLVTPTVDYSLSSDLDLSTLFPSGIIAKIWNPYFYNGTSGWQPYTMNKDNIADMFQNINFGLTLKFTRNNDVPDEKTIALDKGGEWEISDSLTAPVAVASSIIIADTVAISNATTLKTATNRIGVNGSILSKFGLSMSDIKSNTMVSLYPVAYVGTTTAGNFGLRSSKLTDKNGLAYGIQIHRPNADQNTLTIYLSNADAGVNNEVYEESQIGWVGNYQELATNDSEIVVDFGEMS